MSQGRLHHPLSLDDALAVLGVLASAEERLETDFRFLELQEQRVVASRPTRGPRPMAAPTLPTPTTFRAACT